MSTVDPKRLGEHYGKYAEIVALKKPKTEVAIHHLTDVLDSQMDDGKDRDSALTLIEALVKTKSWDDELLSDLVISIAERLGRRELTAEELERWLVAHDAPDERDRVRLCVEVIPPSQVSVQEVLSLAGAQKIVFRCQWSVTDREIVLKQFADSDAANAVFNRELRIHPFSMEHPNIIDTHYFTNDRGDEFLAERFIRAHDEKWRANGTFEGVNLLHDLAAALQFIHQRGLVHGDVKPDNTGYDEGRYLLLDFGVCQEEEVFAELGSPTGTMRTRAPEVITREQTQSTHSDVWALGATVFHMHFGRYPLLEEDEATPPVKMEPERETFEQALEQRIADEYEERVFEALEGLDSRVARLFKRTLTRYPGDRIDAGELAEECRASLASQTRSPGAASPLSAKKRLRQLREHLPEEGRLELMPKRKREDLQAELRYLLVDPGLDAEEIEAVKSLEARIGA